MLPNLIDSRRTEWTLIRMLASPRKVERKWCVPLWIAACPTPRLRANSIQPRRPSANGSVASVPKAWMACAIDPQDLSHPHAKSRLPQPTPSKTCAVSAAPRSTSQPRSASPKPASRAFSNAAASAGSLASSCRSHIHATSARNQARIIHLDIKKLGRFSSVGHRVTGRRTGYCSSQGAGWEFVHVAIDDHSRIARAEIFPDQKKESAVVFLLATVAYFRSLGITVERVMTDNGSCYLSKAFARACKQLAVKHIRIKPYTPQTNGKAERFIQTSYRRILVTEGVRRQRFELAI